MFVYSSRFWQFCELRFGLAIGRGLSGEALVSPDKTGNNMSLPVETLVSPDKTGIYMSFVR